MKAKTILHLFPLFVFTRHGAKKGTDRFYAWPDPLSHLKRMVLCWFFNPNLYKITPLKTLFGCHI
ncbi:hypothetical protein CN373_14155 [Bacillus cereus]|uniref:Uncharacterized protein n=1 Tax=Bacillus cereus TaxID=1396 RepID=A0AA44Q9S5_BACCE|nr:hypothetical protein CN373_14155 [Bacillus cereus]PFN07336.1 hypothetical protein COJ55_10885 [Bacillus cereus]PFO81879.1 hypothetical protein COJ77_15320 [Bacillus cereus]PFR33035.1 hypothetical protein COK19_00480 [Bacillus cereus]PFR99596.1 hypothetical protein COK38_15345 [Bacillus cereus]